ALQYGGGDGMLFDAISALIGSIPAGYEPLIYVLCVPFLMWLLGQFFGILWSLMEGLFRVR
ncbi:hypothetical protein EGM85_11780, partial [Macrococcus caseolyticus]